MNSIQKYLWSQKELNVSQIFKINLHLYSHLDHLRVYWNSIFNRFYFANKSAELCIQQTCSLMRRKPTPTKESTQRADKRRKSSDETWISFYWIRNIKQNKTHKYRMINMKNLNLRLLRKISRSAVRKAAGQVLKNQFEIHVWHHFLFLLEDVQEKKQSGVRWLVKVMSLTASVQTDSIIKTRFIPETHKFREKKQK